MWTWRERFIKAMVAAKEKKGLTQEKLAERWGVKQSTVSGWKSGPRSPSLEDFPKIARELDVSIGHLLLDYEAETDEEIRLINEFRKLEGPNRTLALNLIRTICMESGSPPADEEESAVLDSIDELNKDEISNTP